MFNTHLIIKFNSFSIIEVDREFHAQCLLKPNHKIDLLPWLGKVNIYRLTFAVLAFNYGSPIYLFCYFVDKSMSKSHHPSIIFIGTI